AGAACVPCPARLSELVAEVLGGQPGHHVDAAAGGEGNDQLDRPVRPALLRRRVAGGRQERERTQEARQEVARAAAVQGTEPHSFGLGRLARCVEALLRVPALATIVGATVDRVTRRRRG